MNAKKTNAKKTTARTPALNTRANLLTDHFGEFVIVLLVLGVTVWLLIPQATQAKGVISLLGQCEGQNGVCLSQCTDRNKPIGIVALQLDCPQNFFCCQKSTDNTIVVEYQDTSVSGGVTWVPLTQGSDFTKAPTVRLSKSVQGVSSPALLLRYHVENQQGAVACDFQYSTNANAGPNNIPVLGGTGTPPSTCPDDTLATSVFYGVSGLNNNDRVLIQTVVWSAPSTSPNKVILNRFVGALKINIVA